MRAVWLTGRGLHQDTNRGSTPPYQPPFMVMLDKVIKWQGKNAKKRLRRAGFRWQGPISSLFYLLFLCLSGFESLAAHGLMVIGDGFERQFSFLQKFIQIHPDSSRFIQFSQNTNEDHLSYHIQWTIPLLGTIYSWFFGTVGSNPTLSGISKAL